MGVPTGKCLLVNTFLFAARDPPRVSITSILGGILRGREAEGLLGKWVEWTPSSGPCPGPLRVTEPGRLESSCGRRKVSLEGAGKGGLHCETETNESRLVFFRGVSHLESLL